MNVFFYGLFMDEAVLARKSIAPNSAVVGYVDGFALCIGERATLLPKAGARAYGVMMAITLAEINALYADESVADYRPEPVTVRLSDGRNAEAACYNLPAGKITGTNKGYAKSLLVLATRLDFPDSYLDEIRRAER